MIRAMILPAAFFLDLLMGDPQGMPHPVIGIGKLIALVEKRLRPFGKKNGREEPRRLFLAGLANTVLVCLICWLVPFLILTLCYRLFFWLGWALEMWWCSRLLATKSLRTESMKVYRALQTGSLTGARKAVSMIVGRDTERLDEAGVTKAAVETVAENASDGIIAPMFFFALRGAPLMFLYKGINTMDSMQGYKNEKYLWYGRCAAKLDDAANLIPARLSGLLMVGAAFLGSFDGPGALRIFRRDRYRHASPNSAQTESAVAGALDIQLAGNASYFGKLVEKPTIGDDLRPVEPEDIPRACQLLYLCSLMGMVLFTVLRYVL